MKLFGYEINLKAAFSKEKNKVLDIIPSWYDKNPNVITRGNYSSMLNAYRSWVYVCANKNATAFAQQNLKLYVTKTSKKEKFISIRTKSIDRKVEKYIESNAGICSLGCVKKSVEIEEVVDHKFLNILKNINPFMNRFDFLELLDLFLELVGNAYIYVLTNNLGIPEQLWLLPPDRVYVVPSKEKWIEGYIFRRLDGTEIPFTINEIIHIKFINPKNPYYGWAPLEAVSESYNTDQRYRTYETTLLDNNGVPPIALVAPKDATYTDADFRRILTRWNKTYNGSNQGKTAWLEAGFDIKQLNVSPKEMGYVVGRKWTRDEIAAAFGLPITKIDPSQVRANNEAANIEHLRDTILPRCTRFEEKFNEQLMPMYDERLFVMFDNPVPDDKEFILKERESNLRVLLTSVNEEREKIGMEAVEWGNLPIASQGSVPYDGTKPEPPTGEAPTQEGNNLSSDEGLSDEDYEEKELKLEEEISEIIYQEIKRNYSYGE